MPFNREWKVVSTRPDGSSEVLDVCASEEDALGQMVYHTMRDASDRLIKAGYPPLLPWEEREQIVQHCALGNKSTAVWNTAGQRRDYDAIHSPADLVDAEELVIYHMEPLR